MKMNATAISATTVYVASLALASIAEHRYRKSQKDLHALSEASSKLATSHLDLLESSKKMVNLNQYLISMMEKQGVDLDSFDILAINDIMK